MVVMLVRDDDETGAPQGRDRAGIPIIEELARVGRCHCVFAIHPGVDHDPPARKPDLENRSRKWHWPFGRALYGLGERKRPLGDVEVSDRRRKVSRDSVDEATRGCELRLRGERWEGKRLYQYDRPQEAADYDANRSRGKLAMATSYQ